MNCEGFRTVIDKGYSATTIAERNAVCVHCRTCEECQKMLAILMRVVPMTLGDALAATAAWEKDRQDPEWK